MFWQQPYSKSNKIIQDSVRSLGNRGCPTAAAVCDNSSQALHFGVDLKPHSFFISSELLQTKVHFYYVRGTRTKIWILFLPFARRMKPPHLGMKGGIYFPPPERDGEQQHLPALHTALPAPLTPAGGCPRPLCPAAPRPALPPGAGPAVLLPLSTLPLQDNHTPFTFPITLQFRVEKKPLC